VGARRARALASDPGRFLSAVQIGITLVGLATGAFSGATLGIRLAGWLQGLGLPPDIASTLAMGLVVGNHGAARHMSDKTREHLFSFWGLLDELLNLVLFGLIGLEVIALAFDFSGLWVGLVAIPLVLLARGVSVALPMAALRRFRQVSPHAVKIMTWGGLRGGISIALALSLPEFQGRDLVIGVTYVVVVFSLLVQATTLGRLVRRYAQPDA